MKIIKNMPTKKKVDKWLKQFVDPTIDVYKDRRNLGDLLFACIEAFTPYGTNCF